MRFRVHRGHVEVRAAAPTEEGLVVRFTRLSGTLDLDPDEPARDPKVELALDLRVYETGDRFKSWKVESDLAPATEPMVGFTLARLEQASEGAPGRFQGIAAGQLRFRGRRLDVRARGEATVTRRELELRTTFELDTLALGIAALAFRMYRQDSRLKLELKLSARP